ncbi:DUF417 domain-containing protein [Flavobacterium collinsii]|nr:DUF417 domain-containing protein [Flavobacterium collinsii]
MSRILYYLAESGNRSISMMHIAIAVVMFWIGGLKAFQYEADGIVPFVANSPLMNFFYSRQSPEYQKHKNPEGLVVRSNIEWHRENGTYTFSYALGTVIILIGLTVLLGIWFPKAGLAGGLLTVAMSFATLSFLITTPEVYVADLGGDYPAPQTGFPYLSGAGRLVLKDIIMLAGGFMIASYAAARIRLKTAQPEL